MTGIIPQLLNPVSTVEAFLTVSAPWEPLASANTDEEISQYVRDHSSAYVDYLDRFPLGSVSADPDAEYTTQLELQRYPSAELHGEFWTLT